MRDSTAHGKRTAKLMKQGRKDLDALRAAVVQQAQQAQQLGMPIPRERRHE